MKHISVKGLAEFMAANDSQRRTFVRRFKYPKEDEAHAKIIYYREAREVIEAYHRGNHDAAWLENLALQLEIIGADLTLAGKRRHRHNARAIRSYATHFATRQFRPSTAPRLRLDYSGVKISVAPDLRVHEGSQEKVIKLEFSSEEPAQTEVKVISQVLFEAAQVGRLGIPASAVLYLDVPRGKEYHGARLGSQMRGNIEAACATISDIWDKT